ncbi:7035_t:CDS:2, partial [Scutellospora calospora]
SHLNSLQGVTYGVKENISIVHKRSKYLGEIVKQRLLIGAYFLEKQELLTKARQMLTNFNHSFSGLISSHWSDNLLLLANFAGLPSCSLPIGLINGLPVSININGVYGNDQEVLELAEKLEFNIAK